VLWVGFLTGANDFIFILLTQFLELKSYSNLRVTSHLLQIMLTRSREAVASVLRLLAQEDYALPALIHCQHGKDRTGLVVMLLYLLCGVEKQLILDDYAKSESLLRESRENRELLGMAGNERVSIHCAVHRNEPHPWKGGAAQPQQDTRACYYSSYVDSSS
jgi:hypothetical protein